RIILGVMEVDPQFAPAYFRLHISWEQKGEYQKAIDMSVRGRIAGGESPEKPTATSQTCAQLFPPVGRAAIGSTSWRFCYEIENLMTGVVLPRWLVVTCI